MRVRTCSFRVTDREWRCGGKIREKLRMNGKMGVGRVENIPNAYGASTSRESRKRGQELWKGSFKDVGYSALYCASFIVWCDIQGQLEGSV